MRKILTLLLILMLVIAACGGDDDDDDDAGSGSIDSCEDVGAAFIDELQTLMDGLSDMDIADLSGDEEPEVMTNFEARADELAQRTEDLDCSNEEMATYPEENFDELEANGPVAELMLQALEQEIESGNLFETE